jgi:hypothetical protein
MFARTAIWLIIALIGLADCIALPMQGLSLDWASEWRNLLLLAVFFVLSLLLRWWQRPQAARFTGALIQALVFAHVGTIFTYALTAASPFPIADPLFERADVALGFDWMAWFQWINHHPTVRVILGLAYDSMMPQFLILIGIFAYIDTRRVDELLIASMLALIIIFPIMYLLPSVGAYAPHGIIGGNWEADILEMRSHAVLVIHPGEGIVTFPSYHTVLGILFTNMVRGRRLLFYPLLILNALLLASVMSAGGHYFVDLVSGVAVALVALGGTQYMLVRCSQEAKIVRDTSVAPSE